MCMCVCVCMYVLVCIKETRQLSTIQLPNFLRRLKWKSANFSDIIHLYSVLPAYWGSSVFFPPSNHSKAVAYFPGLAPVHWSPQSGIGRRKIFSSLLQGSRDAVPFVSTLAAPYGFPTSSAISVLHFSLPALPRQFAWSQPSLPVHTYDAPLGKPVVLLLFTAVCRIAVAASASLHCRVLACACSHFHCWAARLFVSCTPFSIVLFFFNLMGIIFAVLFCDTCYKNVESKLLMQQNFGHEGLGGIVEMSLACRLLFFLILWKALVAFTAAGILFAELSTLLYHAICDLC